MTFESEGLFTYGCRYTALEHKNCICLDMHRRFILKNLVTNEMKPPV